MGIRSRILCVSLLLLLVSLSILEVSVASWQFSGVNNHPTANTCPVAMQNCASECDRRCSATSHRKPCLFFCNKCCNKCLCVPPGTFGNKECCSCYNHWKTKEGGPKCP